MSAFSTKCKEFAKKVTAWSLAALTAATCVGALPSVVTETVAPKVSAASDILDHGRRGVIYSSTRSDFRDETIYFLITTRFYDGDPSNNY